MPFTPFHMGIALAIKPAFKRRFSLIVFGVAQVLMDIEPGIGMLRDSDLLHGPSHTLLGALLIAIAASIAGRWLAKPLLMRWNREVDHHQLSYLHEPAIVSWSIAATSALFGTLSHLLLDATMHMDMAPLAPLTDSNPLLFAIPVMHTYGFTVVAGGVGVLWWLIQAIMTRPSGNGSES